MNLGFIPPKKYPELMDDNDFLMVLPNCCDDPHYRQYVKQSKKYKIIDNGAAEGKSIDVHKLIQLATDLKIDEIVAPDVLCDAKETIKSTENFVTVCPSKFRIMAVPQGKNVREWMKCYNIFDINPMINVIGLSKFSVPMCFRERTMSSDIAINRKEAIYHITEQGIISKPLHLLGLRDKHEPDCDAYSTSVRSCDSCLPILAAHLKKDMGELKNISTPDDYFNATLTTKQIEVAEANILKILSDT